MELNKHAAIVLAAGYSSRMKEFKPLLPIGEQTITDRIISIFQKNNVDVILVTGWRGEDLSDRITGNNITIVKNPDYKKGMLSSIQTGVGHLQSHYRSFFVMPVDIPLVRESTIRHLLMNAETYPNRITYPVFDSQYGHPPLIPSSLIPEILNWAGEGGLDTILASHRDLGLDVPVPDENILLDVDNKDDYVLMLDRYNRMEIPSDKECEVLLDIAGTADNVRRHCRKVAEVAVAMSEAVTDTGETVDTDLVKAASLLHDIAKTSSEHDIEGGRILAGFGFGETGHIVSLHSDIFAEGENPSLEAMIVYLADKYIQDEDPVSVEERYHRAEIKYGSIPGVFETIQRYKSDAVKIKGRITKILGFSPDRIAFRY
jgi:putative nucleotidyltransferase with HDIG domain